MNPITNALGDAIAMHSGGVSACVVTLDGDAGESELRMTVREWARCDVRRLNNDLGEHCPGVRAVGAERLPDVVVSLPWADRATCEEWIAGAAWASGAWDVCRQAEGDVVTWLWKLGHGDPLTERTWTQGDVTLGADALRTGTAAAGLRWRRIGEGRHLMRLGRGK